MDKIHLKNLIFHAHHGVLPEERRLGQRFIIDLEMGVDLSEAGRSDDLATSVCYGSVYESVKAVVTEQQFQLLEALAEAIAQKIFAEFERVEQVHLWVKKPEAPIAGVFDYAGVEIVRQR